MTLKAHIIHVGSMNNKGTQALLKSDLAVIKDVTEGDVYFSVSTTDVEGVKRLNPSLGAVFPPIVDIPYERADFFARKLGFGRKNINYKAFALANLIFMFIQLLMSVFSAVLVKVGFKGFFRSELLEHLKACDIVVSYSDENFKEGASFLPLNFYWILTWWTMLISRTWDILIAKYFNKPVVMFPNSIGSFNTSIGRFLSNLALNNCSLILVREPVSYQLVNSLGVRASKILTFDTTWLFESTIDLKPKNDADLRMGVSPGIYSHVFPRREIHNQVNSYAEALDEAVEKFGFSVVFLPHYISGFQYDDLAISRMIMQKMKNKKHATIIEVERVEEFKALLVSMDIVISSKMHPAVFALSGNVPTLCVVYDHKQTGLFQSLNMIECVVSLGELSGGRLFSKICQVWNSRTTIRTKLKTRGSFIRKNVRETIRSALSLFNEISEVSKPSEIP